MANPFNRTIHFLKYNNATILIVVVIFLFGASVFASEPGREAVGGKNTHIEGVDNNLLLTVDLDKHNFDFKIEKIESDEKYYYATFTYLDIAIVDNAWQYQLKERSIKVSVNLKADLGTYLAKELKEIQEKRLNELREVKAKAIAQGEEKRTQVIEYTGLIGKTLDLAGRVFTNYEPVKKNVLPTPATAAALTANLGEGSDAGEASSPDNLTQVYNDYITENDPDQDNIFGANDNCPNVANSGQEDANADGIGDACAASQPAPVNGGAAGDGTGTEGGQTPLEGMDAPAGDTSGEAPTGTSQDAPASEPAQSNSEQGIENVEVIELPTANTGTTE